MRIIFVSLLALCSVLQAGCSRPTEPPPVVAASPTPRQLTEEEQKKEEAAREALQEQKRQLESKDAAALPAVAMPDAAIRVPSPSASASASPAKR